MFEKQHKVRWPYNLIFVICKFAVKHMMTFFATSFTKSLISIIIQISIENLDFDFRDTLKNIEN